MSMANDAALRDFRPFPKLDVDFVEARVKLRWSDLAWALSNGWLGYPDIAALASRIAQDPSTQVEIELARDDESLLRQLVGDLAATEKITAEETSRRWLLIAVAWAYRHRELYPEPLAVVEAIWEAFGHAPVLDGLIPWMPATPGKPAGIEGIMHRWQSLADRPIE